MLSVFYLSHFLDSSAFRVGEDARAELGQPPPLRLRLAEALLHQQAARGPRHRETLGSSNHHAATGAEPIAFGGETGTVSDCQPEFQSQSQCHSLNFCIMQDLPHHNELLQSFSIPNEDAAPVLRRSKRISMLQPPPPQPMGPPAPPGPRVHPLEVRSHWSAKDQQEHNGLILGILNTANIGMLQKLPGIGPKTAIKLHTQR